MKRYDDILIEVKGKTYSVDCSLDDYGKVFVNLLEVENSVNETFDLVYVNYYLDDLPKVFRQPIIDAIGDDYTEAIELNNFEREQANGLNKRNWYE